MMKILFRVDSNAKIGMGHLVRCLTLADHLKEVYGTENTFCLNNFRGGIKRVTRHEYPIMELGDTFDQCSELPVLSKYLEKNHVDLFVIDMIRQSQTFVNFLKKSGKVAYFCDGKDFKTYSADLVINHNICLTSTIWDGEGSKCLLGPDYFILPPFFHTKANGEKKNAIFINQGGGDPFNLTCKILRAIRQLEIERSFYLNIVLGAAYKEEYKKELLALLEDYPIPHWVYEDISQFEMYRLMKGSWLAITAAGNALYELSFLGIPPIVISHHENHDIVARQFEKNNACVNLGIGNQISEEAIRLGIASMLANTKKKEKITVNAKRLVDGKGLERVGKALMKLCGYFDSR